MDSSTPIVKLKLDIIFKRIFGDQNNTDVIAAFISEMLDIPRESIDNIIIDNVELTPEYLDEKFSRLDLKLDVDGRTVNIEMQVNYEPDFKERTLYYWSKIFSDELKTGERYGKLNETICINIINFNLFQNKEQYHSKFVPMEITRHEILSEKASIHFFELKKVNESRKHKPVEDWLDLINAETEGDLMTIENKTTIPEVKKTIVMLRQLSGDEKLRKEAYYREKRLHDEASALGNARDEGYAKGREKGLEEGIAKGREEGIAKGREEGIAKGKSEIIEYLLSKGLSKDYLNSLLENNTT